MKNIVILNASPRKNGFCKTYIDLEIERLNNTDIDIEFNIEILNIYDLNIECCTDCGYCEHKKGCRIDDDMTKIYKILDKMDVLLVVSPVYFNSVPAKFKILIDRLQAVYNSKYKLNDSMIDRTKKRLGAIKLFGGQKPDEKQFDSSIDIICSFFKAINTHIEDITCLSNTEIYRNNINKEIYKKMNTESFVDSTLIKINNNYYTTFSIYKII